MPRDAGTDSTLSQFDSRAEPKFYSARYGSGGFAQRRSANAFVGLDV